MIKAWFTRENRTITALLCMLCGIMFLQGCAESYATAVRHYREAPVCCASMAELPTGSLRVGDTLGFELDTNSPLYNFDAGKSYFRFFTLPEGPYPYKVTISSYLVGDYLRTAYIFSPHIVTVDEKRRVIRTTGPGSFNVVPTNLYEKMHSSGNFHHKLEGGLIFTGVNRDERYLLVVTTDELLKGKTAFPLEEVPMLILGSGRGTSAKPGEIMVPHAPSGVIDISLSPIVPTKQPTSEVLPVSGTGTILSSSGKLPVTPLPAVTGAGEKKTPATDGPEQIAVTLASGKEIGRLAVGKTLIDEARRLYDESGSGLGPEQRNGTTFTIGTATLAPRRLFTPPGTFNQLFFDDNGKLVLFINKASADFGSTARDFRLRFPGSRETGRLVGSFELQTDLTPCVTLIAVFRTVNDTIDSTGLGYICPLR
jgi:maltose operon protein